MIPLWQMVLFWAMAVAGEIRGRSCLVVVLFCCSSEAAQGSLPSAAAVSLSQVGQGTPRTSSAGFWFCSCLRITRAQGTSDTQVVLPCWAAQLFCSFHVVPCSYRRVTALDVFVTTALAHPHCSGQLGHEGPVPCVAVPLSPEGFDVGKLLPGFPEGLPMQE